MLFKLEGLFRSTQGSIGFLSKAHGRDGEYDDFSETRPPTTFEQTVGETLLAEWSSKKYLSHMEFRLVPVPGTENLMSQCDTLECILEDEEAAHAETLNMLRIVREERYALMKQNDALTKQNSALRTELEARGQIIRDLRSHCETLRKSS